MSFIDEKGLENGKNGFEGRPLLYNPNLFVGHTLPLLGYYFVGAVRFVFLLLDEGHMGPHKQSGKTVISLYIMDDLGYTDCGLYTELR